MNPRNSSRCQKRVGFVSAVLQALDLFVSLRRLDPAALRPADHGFANLVATGGAALSTVAGNMLAFKIHSQHTPLNTTQPDDNHNLTTNCTRNVMPTHPHTQTETSPRILP